VASENLVLRRPGGVVDEKDLQGEALAGGGLESGQGLEQMVESPVVDDDGGGFRSLG
jgi:hypothetical protein